jgi:uncharacterized protein (DUF1015 family)
LPTIDPIANALVPADSAAADALGAPNYDEFQSDEEVWKLLRERPHSVLRVTMPHCDVATIAQIGDEDSEETLRHAAAAMEALRTSPLTREVRNVLWVYELTSPRLPGKRQLGLGGMARTDEIRTDVSPGGCIIRNEGIREAKARGRAVLTKATRADMGTVNNAVDDASGALLGALSAHAAAEAPAFVTPDEAGDRHRVWLVERPAQIQGFQRLLAAEPRAYVADGNHRSAAAAMLGYSHFLCVFFPAPTMTIAPYNRLIGHLDGIGTAELLRRADRAFERDAAPAAVPFQPTLTHEIGVYDGGRWWRLRPRPGTFDADDAAEDIDADIVQRHLFGAVLGITDPRDERLTFVGANRDAAWLAAQVDAGRFMAAVTLPPVTMGQFIRVCLQGKLMPPKSTWFIPKIRSGLVMALL